MSPRNPSPLSDGAASGRSALQAGFSVTGLIGLLDVFNVVHLSTAQVLYLVPFLTGAGAFVMRKIENRVGKGVLRDVT